MKHSIKIHPQHFERVLDGSKTFEIRDNDRCYQAGDEVVLNEWDPNDFRSDKHTGRKLEFKIGCVYFLEGISQARHGLVVFSLLKEKP